MNKYKNIIILIAFSILFGSCNLDLAPENIMVDQITYKSAKTTEAALLGAYTRMNASFSGAPTGVNNYANIGYPLLFAEIGTPTIVLRENSSFINMETSDYNSSDHDAFILSMWRNTYNAIDYANNIIANINKYSDYDKTQMNQYIAEAKFLRAYEYFLLLGIFGDGALTGDMSELGVIMRLTPYDGYKPADIQSRVTVGESYAQIIKDIKDALPYLINNSATDLKSRTRATKCAAYALLSRVYLYKGSYKNNFEELQLASDYADSVINSSTKGYVFSTSYTHHTNWMFPINPTGAETNSSNYSDEVILLSPCYSSVTQYGNGVGSMFYNKANFSCDPAFIAKYDIGDRRGYIDPTSGVVSLIWQGSQTNYPNDKTSYKYNNGSGYNNVVLFRVSEAKLTKAEAYARIKGVNDESIKQLNDVYRKPFETKPVAYLASDFTSGEQLVDRILLERQRELAYEGHTRFDLIRNNKPLRKATISNERKILPIPDYDIRISYGKIIQNRGYKN